MIKLRPHHLLCTQSYMGAGYSDGFVENMNKIVDNLRSDKDLKIEIVFENDNICEACPHNIGGVSCESDDVVLPIDNRVKNILELENGEYCYSDLINKLNEKITKDDFIGLCCECQWWDGICKDIFMNKILKKYK
ncbi:DUF1284 domain-containing protein [Peptoniphilus sp. oral taxon 386]|uniref:DUF1284 domain-containing protein n=1 Tax=Peptoniphilus sp. oral taxon 386 TaxID=652713 RepID=UPI0001DA9A2C|nr:DUF1284 domain-containing protein [Peptoniphilus sp. oral taxon 386]EFI41862.1 hypothetical protein HMPREF0629_00491 [Peptoniphilus sp. oral taxon 386 str. F0131]